MSNPSTTFHKIWIEQCAATEDIREQFGTRNALDDRIGEKLFPHYWAQRLLFLSQASPVESYACGLGIEDAYDQTSVEIANHVGRCQSQAYRF